MLLVQEWTLDVSAKDSRARRPLLRSLLHRLHSQRHLKPRRGDNCGKKRGHAVTPEVCRYPTDCLVGPVYGVIPVAAVDVYVYEPGNNQSVGDIYKASLRRPRGIPVNPENNAVSDLQQDVFKLLCRRNDTPAKHLKAISHSLSHLC